ncbi:MAG: bacillithiol biosynthesis cysteine-adding enzyme BshC [Crocinitomicaceae bacterium]
MLKDFYSFDELKFSSPLIRDLINEKTTIEKYVNRFFDLDQIQTQIKEKKFSNAQREVLVKALKKQSQLSTISPATEQNIEVLKNDNSFTITTGHQLNMLTGPLYSIYKIGQVIEICKVLKEQNPGQNFVPIFWMATEDHDFEEINHINLFGQKIAWEKEGQENVIAGRIEFNQMEGFLNEIESKFQNPEVKSKLDAFLATYKTSKNMAEATRKLVNHLFGEHGIVVLDGDDAELKKMFEQIALQEVAQLQVEKTVEATNAQLAADNYHQQVYVRECNLFYIKPEGARERIKYHKEQFVIGDRHYTLDEIKELIIQQPENFSPNALMRPLYQEQILPNLAYIGGGGEIAYWLQLKSTFEGFDVTFPMLRVRDSVLLIKQNEVDLLKELELDLMDLKLGVDQILKDMATENAQDELDLTDIRETLFNVQQSLITKADAIQKGMDGMIAAEFAKFAKSIDRIESKMLKAEKGKFEKTQKQIQKITDRYFPNGGFQERYENILMYYLAQPDIIDKLIPKLQAEKTPVVRLIQL